MKKTIFFLSLFFTVYVSGFSQSITPFIVNSAGGSAVSGNNYYDWSVGEETLIETLSKPNIIVTGGVLQPEAPYRDFETECDLNNIKVYPNPTSGGIKINLFFNDRGKITLNLYDASARLLTTRNFDYQGFGRTEDMDLSRFPSGFYLLNVLLKIPGVAKPQNCYQKIIKLR